MAKVFSEGEKVFAKMRGYPPWPARIEGIADSTPGKVKYHVLFFGTMQRGVCKGEEIFSYLENKDKYGKTLKARGFKEALEQISGFAKVPQLVPKIVNLNCRKGFANCAHRNAISNNNSDTVNFTFNKKAIKRKEIVMKDNDNIHITNSLSNGHDFQNFSLKAPDKSRKVNVCVKRKQMSTVEESGSVMYEFLVSEPSEGKSQVKAVQNQPNNSRGNEEPVSSSSLYSVHIPQKLQKVEKVYSNNTQNGSDNCNKRDPEEKECPFSLSTLSPPPSVEENDSVMGELILSNAANGEKALVKTVRKRSRKVITNKEPVSTSSLFFSNVSQKLQNQKNIRGNETPSEVGTSNHTETDDFSSPYPLSPPPSVEDNDSIVGEFVPSNKAGKAKRSMKTTQMLQRKGRAIKEPVLSCSVFSADVSRNNQTQINISNGSSPSDDRYSEERHLPSSPSPSSSRSLTSSVTPSSSRSGQNISRSGRVIKRKVFPDEIHDATPKRKKMVGRPRKNGSQQFNSAIQHPSDHHLQNGSHFDENVPHHSRHMNAIDPRLEMNPNERVHLQVRPIKKQTARDWLATENCMTRLDTLVRSQLGMNRANPKQCIRFLEDMSELNLRPLMLKKHPEVVETIKRLRRYVGNAGAWNMSDEQRKEFEEHASQIRLKAEDIFDKFRAMFAVPDITMFLEVFADSVIAFQALTHDWPLAKIYALVSEPKMKIRKPRKPPKMTIQPKSPNSSKQLKTLNSRKPPKTTKSRKQMQNSNSMKSSQKTNSQKSTPTVNSPKSTQTLDLLKSPHAMNSLKELHGLKSTRSSQEILSQPSKVQPKLKNLLQPSKVQPKLKNSTTKKTMKKVYRARRTKNTETKD